MSPECRRPATFHVERHDRERDIVGLKSLEHGHTMEGSGLGPGVCALGFVAVRRAGPSRETCYREAGGSRKKSILQRNGPSMATL